uniref:Uncharacterized protein n=1 Tax=Rhizophora mucronata TaxID=61149 RepID=A0A2P2PP36_RHIMU
MPSALCVLMECLHSYIECFHHLHYVGLVGYLKDYLLVQKPFHLKPPVGNDCYPYSGCQV